MQANTMTVLAMARTPCGPLIGLARLATASFRGEDLAPVCQALIERAQASGDDVNALHDLSTALQLAGQRELGLGMLRAALDKQPVFALLSDIPPIDPIRVLLLLAPGDLAQNNTVEFLAQDRDITLLLIYIERDLPAFDALPAHDVVMVGVCESVGHDALLMQLADQLQDWPRPVINPPAALRATARDRVSRALRDVAGLSVPPTVCLSRPDLEAVADGRVRLPHVAEGIDFPCIIRPVDSQKGTGLRRADAPADVRAFLAADPAAVCYLAPYVDYRSPDGFFRKYRVLLIDAKPYLCHVAISANWVVHYMSAGMTADDAIGEAKRAEEARCMRDFDRDFLVRHGTALAAIAHRLGLDYVGVDCGFDVDGKLLLFEVDAGMTVHLMDPCERFPYKHEQMPKVFAAFETMLRVHAAR